MKKAIQAFCVGKNIQFVEDGKSLKKRVDKRRSKWYDNKAVARESEGKSEKTA